MFAVSQRAARSGRYSTGAQTEPVRFSGDPICGDSLEHPRLGPAAVVRIRHHAPDFQVAAGNGFMAVAA